MKANPYPTAQSFTHDRRYGFEFAGPRPPETAADHTAITRDAT
jgi:hypothetical protein